jgi:hypothetical protein
VLELDFCLLERGDTRATFNETAEMDETGERADPKGRLLPPPDNAEAGYARDLVSLAAVMATPPNGAPELRG